jgi:hypothetical protein
MKTPSAKDRQPKRDNLGPTGPAAIDGYKRDKAEEADGVGTSQKEIEDILDRKRAQTPPG